MRDKYNILRQRFITSFIIAGSLLFFASCGSESYTQQEEKTKQKGEQTLYFTENEDGQAVHYEANFNNGEITSLYKDGVKIPEDKIKDYKELVYDNLDSIGKDDNDFFASHHHGPKVFHFDMDSLSENMKEWRKKFKAENFNFKFDHKKFKEDMEKLKEELKDCDNIVIHIDKDKMQKDIEEGLKNLDQIKIHKFDFDEDELNKNLKRMTIEIEKNKNDLELNMESLKEQMEDLKDEMGVLSIEMNDLDTEMKNLNSFLDGVKVELVKDGLIKSSDEEFEIELSDSRMEVNDEKVPDNLLEKYKALYKKHFDMEIKGKIKFQN